MDLLSTERGRRVLFAALYLSEGAPIGFLWWALPPKLRAAGVPVSDITALTAALVLPWTFKFLWAPLVDRWRPKRVGFRLWIGVAQLAMGASLLALVGLDPAEQMSTVAPLLMLHACAAATQDVAIDGLAIAVVTPTERGRLQGWTQAGMLAGRAAFGGGALLLEELIGARAVLFALTAVTWSSLALLGMTLRSSEPERRPDGGAPRGLASALREAFWTRTSALALSFALLSGAGFEAVGALAGSLLVDVGMDQTTVGSFFAGPSVLATVCGALLAGRLSDRFPRVRVVGLTLGYSVASVWLVSACVGLSVGEPALLASLTACYLGIGMFVASSYALFMDLADRRLGATHFSAFMGATNGCEAWSGWAAGRLQGPLGYPASMAVLGGLSLLSLPVLRALSRTERAEHGEGARVDA